MIDTSLARLVRTRRYVPLLLGVLAFVFYYFTLAPTVLWGDDAGYQREAYVSTIRATHSQHWLWYQAVRLFARLPVGDVAYRTNLCSAAAAAATVVLVTMAARAFGVSTFGAAVAGLSLAVAHTFWMHAVRAEVYTVFTLMMAVELWLWGRWERGGPWPMRAAAALFGLALLGHQMAVLLLPAWGLLLWLGRKRLSWKECGVLAALFAAGLTPWLLAVRQQFPGESMVNLPMRYFVQPHRGLHYALFDFRLKTLPRDLGLWLALLGLQFPGAAGVLGLWAAYRGARAPGAIGKHWLAVAALYLTAVLFAFAYHVNDQYVFYLPSYVAFALIVGLGWDMLAAGWRRLAAPGARAIALAALALTPPVLYFGLASAFTALDFNPLGIRELPGREPNFFFIWPAKNGYYGAAEYGQSALAALPEGGYVLASHTPYQTLSYLQVAEGQRPDVTLFLVQATDDLAELIHTLPAGAEIYLADDDLRYYDLSNVPQFRLEPAGVLYRLVLPPTAAGGP